MTLASLRPFALNCGLLLLPAVAWNVALTKHLPAAFQPADFWREIPALLALSENGLRIAVFVLPFFMPLDLATAGKRRALLVFIAGTFVYFASWLAIILYPDSVWSKSLLGFAAPAYTPLLWLLGIALLGKSLFWGAFYRWWMYLVLSSAFLIAHISHTALVFFRNH